MVLLAGALSACVPNAAMRTHAAPESQPCAGQPGDCATDVWHRLAATDGDHSARPAHPVHIGFVEFDDQGALYRPDLKEAVVARVRTMAKDHPLLILVFAHGWKHNAAASDTNVTDFANVLRSIAVADERVCTGLPLCRDRHVVGIYLGWRGLSASLEPFKELSFWTRKGRAHRVGTDGAMEILADLKKIDALQKGNHLVLVGHSFGGALIYTAIQQQLMRDTAFLNTGSVARTAADLIVLVNPAFEAARFAALERRARTMEHSRTQRPVLAVFTSRDDVATRSAFPIGRTLGTLFEHHSSAGQRHENRTALGHHAPFVTHNLDLSPTVSTSSQGQLQLSGFENYACGWQNFQSGATDVWSLGDIQLQRRMQMQTGTQRQNPYLNVSVDPGIIAGHNDIWGARFSEFLYRFVAVQSLRSGVSCPP